MGSAGEPLLKYLLKADGIATEQCLAVDPQPRGDPRAIDPLPVGRDRTTGREREPVEFRPLDAEYDVFQDAGPFVILALLVEVDGSRTIGDFRQQFRRAS